MDEIVEIGEGNYVFDSEVFWGEVDAFFAGDVGVEEGVVFEEDCPTELTRVVGYDVGGGFFVDPDIDMHVACFECVVWVIRIVAVKLEWFGAVSSCEVVTRLAIYFDDWWCSIEEIDLSFCNNVHFDE